MTVAQMINTAITTPMTDAEILEKASEILASQYQPKQMFNSSHLIKKFIQCKMSNYDREVFAVVFLDTQMRLIKYEELFAGTINSCTVHMREVAKRALELNARFIIMAHNHPSGDSTPSEQDYTLTKHLKTVFNFLELHVLDHIVVGGSEVTSMVECGTF